MNKNCQQILLAQVKFEAGFIHVLFEVSSAPYKRQNIPKALSLPGHTKPLVLQLACGPAAPLSEPFRGRNKYCHPQPKYCRMFCSSASMLWYMCQSPDDWSKPEGNGTSGQIFVCRLQICKQIGLGLSP